MLFLAIDCNLCFLCLFILENKKRELEVQAGAGASGPGSRLSSGYVTDSREIASLLHALVMSSVKWGQ